MRRLRAGFLLILALHLAVLPAHADCLAFIRSMLGRGRAGVSSSPSDVTTTVTQDHDRLRETRNGTVSLDERQVLLEAYAKPLSKPLWQRATVFANWAFAGIIGTQFFREAYENPKALVPVILLAPALLWIADLGGQIFHKWLDSYASERNPIWGRTARDFRKHHEVPNNLDHERYVSNVTPASVMIAPLMGAAAFSGLSPDAATPIAFFLMAVLNTTEFHRQAHLTNPNPLFRFLQRIGLALDRSSHMRHHSPPFDSEFAVFLGWSNGFARRADLWNRMDRWFWRYSGRMPHNWIQDPRSIPDEIVNEILADLQRLNTLRLTSDDIQDLNTHANTYPGRTSEKVLDMIREARDRWQRDFFLKRRSIFQELSRREPERALTEWRQEQEDYPWLYNNTVHPLIDIN